MLERQDDDATLCSAPRPSRTLRFTSRPTRPSTECASSSRCQRSEDQRRATEDRDPLRQPFRPSSRRALARPTKQINRIGRIGALRRAQVSLDTLDIGGARRDRTDDLMLAKHALSQLSYGPVSRPAGGQRPVVVGLGGLEPPTSRLSSARSNQLSYKPGRRKKSTPAHRTQSRSRRGASISLKMKERRRRRDPAPCGLTGRFILSRTTNRQTRANPSQPAMAHLVLG